MSNTAIVTNLLSELLAGFTRSDSRYGGSYANRTRMLRETIEKVRQAVGPDIEVTCRELLLEHLALLEERQRQGELLREKERLLAGREKEIEDIHKSLSWKITTTPRALGSILGKKE